MKEHVCMFKIQSSLYEYYELKFFIVYRLHVIEIFSDCVVGDTFIWYQD